MINKLNIVIIILISLLSQSCDTSYSISIRNNSESEIIIDAKLSNHFNPGLTTTFITDKNNRLQFKIKPEQVFYCGFTNEELKDELPFMDLIIYMEKDTIVAENKNEVLELFDKKWTGNLKTPYIITIE